MLVLGAAMPKAEAADGVTCKTFIKNASPQKIYVWVDNSARGLIKDSNTQDSRGAQKVGANVAACADETNLLCPLCRKLGRWKGGNRWAFPPGLFWVVRASLWALRRRDRRAGTPPSGPARSRRRGGVAQCHRRQFCHQWLPNREGSTPSGTKRAVYNRHPRLVNTYLYLEAIR
jgi:hypothetical protein